MHLMRPEERWSGASLVAQSVSVKFGGLSALTDVDVQINPGRIIGLIGPNGAGKTTLVNVISGFQVPTSGQVRMGAHELVGTSPHAVRWRGISRTFQAVRLFRDMTVRENIVVACLGLGFSARHAESESRRVIEWLGIQDVAEMTAGTLPYTDQRRVAIGRAIVGNPSFVLLDEPAAGMSEAEGNELSALVKRLAVELAAGVMVIEHNITLVLGLCAEIYVLDSGKIIEHGSPDVIKSSVAVRHAYIGTALDDIGSERRSAIKMAER
jgi:branched-chain amino acid transport system ATP-binding protein